MIIIGLLIAFALCPVPTIVGFRRRHRQAIAIMILNVAVFLMAVALFFAPLVLSQQGFIAISTPVTLIAVVGWLVALVWSVAAPTPEKPR